MIVVKHGIYFSGTSNFLFCFSQQEQLSLVYKIKESIFVSMIYWFYFCNRLYFIYILNRIYVFKILKKLSNNKSHNNNTMQYKKDIMQ